MSIENDTKNHMITASALALSIFIIVYTIIFMIIGRLSLIPLDPTIFWIFMILCFICLVFVGYIAYQGSSEGYEKAWVGILILIEVVISMVFLLLCYLGLYQVLDMILAIFGN
ncbi:MAG: hypothetical protein EAX96_03980 [Candidatus Lokiarchaeota archaeon]|nr:hypothetical protein [Candidatus Lokiarchaeota archaeon]